MLPRKRSSLAARTCLVLATFAATPIIAATPLPFYPGPTGTNAAPYNMPVFGMGIGVSDGGVAVGNSVVSNYAQRVVRFSPSTSQELPAITLAPGNATGGFSSAIGMTRDGTIVGQSRRYNGTTFVEQASVYWDASGAIHELQGLTNATGTPVKVSPTAVSRNGMIAGAAGAAPLARWTSPTATPVQLATLSGKNYANAINTSGTIVGYANTNGPLVALRWLGTGTAYEQLADAEPTSPYRGSVALAVNDAGGAVGYSDRNSGNVSLGTTAALWKAGGTAFTDLGALPTATDGYRVAQAQKINNAGDIAGVSSKFGSGSYPVRWLPNSTTPIELGTLGHDLNGLAQTTIGGMNAGGTIVGSSAFYTTASAPATHAAVWTKASNAAIDLNAYLPANSNFILTRADAISDTGWVSGLGSFDPDGTGPLAGYGRLFTMLVPQAGTFGSGDANFDGAVNFGDLVLLAQHYDQANAALLTGVGDVNLDGTTNFADLVVLAQHYNTTLANVASLGNASFAADWALARSLVPEPIALSLTVMALPLIGRRR